MNREIAKEPGVNRELRVPLAGLLKKRMSPFYYLGLTKLVNLMIRKSPKKSLADLAIW